MSKPLPVQAPAVARVKAVLLTGLVLAGIWGLATFSSADSHQWSLYQALEPKPDMDILEQAMDVGFLERNYELAKVLGEKYPGAALIFPDGGEDLHGEFEMRLVGFGRAASVSTTEVGADVIAQSIPLLQREATAVAGDGTWVIYVDPMADQQSFVYLSDRVIEGGALVERTLVEANLEGGLG